MKRTLLLFSALLISSIVFAQAPDAFKYQAVVRDNSGNLITEQSVGIQIKILKGATDGTSVYSETHSPTTNAYGLVNLEIGSGTSTDDLSAINWGDDDYFIQVSLDATGGTSYELMGTSQLLSVPYALHSTVADSVVKESQTLAIDGNTLSISDGNSVDLPTGETGQPTGNSIVYFQGEITDAEAAEKIQNEVGSNTKYIYIQYTSQLTTLNFTGLTELIEFHVALNTALSTITLSDLTECKELIITQSSSLSSLDVSSLVGVRIFEIGDCDILSTVNLPNLIGAATSIAFVDNLILSSINIPNYESGGFGVRNCNISTISFPKLKFASTIDIQNCPSLSTIDISGVTSFGEFFRMEGNAFTSDVINDILAHMVAILPTSPQYIRLSGQNPPAPPTGQGITDKDTLIANGKDVQTD